MSRVLPLMFLTARDSDADVISGLRLGADDYLTKDISLPHLMARIVALFRRVEMLSGEQNTGTWLERGALRLYYLDREGQAANKNFYLDGAMIWPITPVLREQPVHFWVEALEPSRVWALPWDGWAAATQGFAPWRALEHRVLAALLQDKMAREHAFLQLTATERYLALQAQHPEWLARIPLRQLASWLGITDVALSRIRRRLK